MLKSSCSYNPIPENFDGEQQPEISPTINGKGTFKT